MKYLKFRSVLSGGGYPDVSLPDYLRNADDSFSRERTLLLLHREEYGFVDESGVRVDVADATDGAADFARGYSVCGKAKHTALEFTVQKAGKSAGFTADVFIPAAAENPDFIVQLDFVKNLPTKYCPIEELLDRGVAIAHIFYLDVASDDGDFSNGIAPVVRRAGDPYPAGKIALWAYAARIVAHYLAESGLARAGIYVAGHSRLGKTALLACAEDEIFAGCMVNDSGCCGAAISRGKGGETVAKITETFPFWFTPSFIRYGGREKEMPFDQHFLAACIAPRKIFIGAASEDTWADTNAQYLCAEAAGEVYREMNAAGLAPLDKMLRAGEKNTGGNIKFFVRKGPHYFSREDWNFYLDCLQNANTEREK